MRLECLFQQVLQAALGDSEWDSRAALQGIFEIFDLASRAELKAELLKELERHSATLNRFRQVPGIDLETLDAILAELTQVSGTLRDPRGLSLETIRRHGFLSTVRRRSTLPAGTCPFDLPVLQYWLQKESAARSEDLQSWLLAFEPMRRAVNLILELIRGSAVPRPEIAVQGFFQKVLDSSAPSQMVRVILPGDSSVFPEISGGRQRFSVRFMAQPDLIKRPHQCTEDISFQLVCCVI
jgi:cell division protein ZapD